MNFQIGQSMPSGADSRSGRAARPLPPPWRDCAVIGFAVATPIFAPDLIFEPKPPAFTVMSIADATNDPQTTLMAVNVTDRLTDGLARIGNIRVLAPRPAATPVSQGHARALFADADFVVNGELQRTERSCPCRRG
jgi:hypothetical protein